MLIREIRMQDAENLLILIKEVERTSAFMLMEPGEREMTLEQQQKRIEIMDKQNNSTIFVAEENGKLIGYLFVMGGSTKRTKHSAYLVIGILQEHRGKGIGTKLFEHVTTWASNHDISRLELTVVTENESGVALYKRSGFDIEGTKRNSLMINDRAYDEYYMSKLL
ncbi:GNAT family N-acetyltransferase [Sutcliffiella horikoshii]|uniref:GNAT family N-acetyltransferase n=1 Tax=Sutcliffiella horikoshii TaxID=79883 RepID=UPI001CFD2A50|nr:GNAT family N-acetyltransferase [Sutcliffiella horikoshii]